MVRGSGAAKAPPQQSDYHQRMMAAAMEARRRAEAQEALSSKASTAGVDGVVKEGLVNDAEVARQQMAEQKAARKAERQAIRAKKEARRAEKQRKKMAKASVDRPVPSTEKPDEPARKRSKSSDRRDRHASNSSKKRKRAEREPVLASESETSEPTPPPKKVKTKKSSKKSSQAVEVPQVMEPAIVHSAEPSTAQKTKKVHSNDHALRTSSPVLDVVSKKGHTPPVGEKSKKKKKKKKHDEIVSTDVVDTAKKRKKRKKRANDDDLLPDSQVVGQEQSEAVHRLEENQSKSSKRDEPPSRAITSTSANADLVGPSNGHGSMHDHAVSTDQQHFGPNTQDASRRASSNYAAARNFAAQAPVFLDSQSATGFSRRIGPFVESASPTVSDDVSVKEESAGGQVDNEAHPLRHDSDDEHDTTYDPAADDLGPQDPPNAIAEQEYVERIAEWTHHRAVLASFLNDNADCEPDSIVNDPDYCYDTSDYDDVSGVDSEPDDEDLRFADPECDNDDIFGYQLCPPTPRLIAAARQAKKDKLPLCRYPIFEVTPWTIFLRTWNPLLDPPPRPPNVHLNASQRSPQDRGDSAHENADQASGDPSLEQHAGIPQSQQSDQEAQLSASNASVRASQNKDVTDEAQQHQPSVLSQLAGSQDAQARNCPQPSQPSYTDTETPAF